MPKDVMMLRNFGPQHLAGQHYATALLITGGMHMPTHNVNKCWGRKLTVLSLIFRGKIN